MGGYGGGGNGSPELSGQAKPLDRQVMVALIEGLALLGGNTARQTIKDLISGTLKTDDDRTSAEAAIGTLVKEKSAENEKMLFSIITAPEVIRPAALGGQPGASPGYAGSMSGFGRGGTGSVTLTAADLQAMALSLVMPTASDEFRKRLAEHVVKESTPPENRRQISDLLLKPSPENLPSQLILHGAQTKEVQASLEDEFTTCSSAALALLLGVPPRFGAPSSGSSGGGAYGPPGGRSQPPGTGGPPAGMSGPPGGGMYGPPNSGGRPPGMAGSMPGMSGPPGGAMYGPPNSGGRPPGMAGSMPGMSGPPGGAMYGPPNSGGRPPGMAGSMPGMSGPPGGGMYGPPNSGGRPPGSGPAPLARLAAATLRRGLPIWRYFWPIKKRPEICPIVSPAICGAPRW